MFRIKYNTLTINNLNRITAQRITWIYGIKEYQVGTFNPHAHNAAYKSNYLNAHYD